LLSAIATATTDANVSIAVIANAAAAASVFTDAGLCFCHYRHHHICMRRSPHDRRFHHSCCRFLVDCWLINHCHCPANAIANATTNQCAIASHLPGWLLHGFLLRHNLLMRTHFSMHCLVVLLPLVAPPSHLPWVVVASPLVAMPLSLDAPAAAS
jgi:hypothetical protein